VLFKAFYRWLRERNIEKAEKLKTVCAIYGINVEDSTLIVEGIVILLRKIYNLAVEDFVDFILDQDIFFYSHCPTSISWLIEEDIITKERYKQYLCERAKTLNIILVVRILVTANVFKLTELIDVLKLALEYAPDKEICGSGIANLARALWIEDKISYEDSQYVLKELGLCKRTFY